ncbi:MAG: phosphocholine cytidylyltransferase family protein [Bacteroidetes bacterium]|nr:phosphocholine cytidylyltransferase family protein [Bacteroidota bacterium]
MEKITAIILAAGQGTRLRPLTDEIPKCMVEVAGKPMLYHQLDCLEEAGIEDIIVVTGYKEEKIVDSRIKRKIFNPDFAYSNMIYSLFCAEEYMSGELLICYGDIIYSKNVLQQILNVKHAVTIASDEEWLSYWQQRCEDPLSDAETFKKGSDNKVSSLGQKPSSIDDIEGQFIGLIKFSDEGTKLIKQTYNECLNNTKCSNNAWNSGRDLKNTYMTDLMNYLASNDLLHYHPIDRGWFEVDNFNDLQVANNNISQITID